MIFGGISPFNIFYNGLGPNKGYRWSDPPYVIGLKKEVGVGCGKYMVLINYQKAILLEFLPPLPMFSLSLFLTLYVYG